MIGFSRQKVDAFSQRVRSSRLRGGLILIVAMTWPGLGGLAQETNTATNAVRFAALDVYVDAGEQPLAAYQVEIAAPTVTAKIVGVEGGEHPAFREPPSYDLRALQHERVILAAFSTGAADALPKGRTRVATLHVLLTAPATPQFTVKLHTAASVDARKIAARAMIEERNKK